MLEPYDGKLSRTVLRGERGREAPDLPGNTGGNMKFYIINNDNTPLELPLFHKAWIEDGYAYTSGEDKYGKALKKLEKEDCLFCYVRGMGIVACGKVIAECGAKGT